MIEKIHLDISVGKSRRETKWKKTKITWDDLVTKLKTTHRTHESFKEYLALDKDEQTAIKDVGGFVGGLINGGRRKKGAVLNRQLITLDVDEADTHFWEDFQMAFSNCALIYTTHKHSYAKPRLRLLMPMTRPVMRDEYEAIGRKIAEMCGIDQFDKTTYEPERLMYWPSTSKDGEFFCLDQPGKWIDPDEILGMYHNWKDTAEWPDYKSSDEEIRKGAKRQGDPLLKPGPIGAWCREYDIHDVIENHLSDVYEPSAVTNRYTYVGGSVANGLVVYDDNRFCYSHHATDPISGKLCNAFDLVRIHKFGDRDDNSGEQVPINKKPSYLAMLDLVTGDTRVRKRLSKEKYDEAVEEFNDLAFDDPEVTENDPGDDPVDEANKIIGDKKPKKQADPDLWRIKLDIDRKGKCHSTINNIMLILENEFKGCFALDLFENREIVLKDLPWRKITPGETNYMKDSDDSGLRHYLENVYEITGQQKIKDALVNVFFKNRFHPIRNYLSGLLWDGEERIDTLLIDFFGAEDSKYTRAVMRKTLVAAVKRVFKPGCKYDTVLTLLGPQGKGKSTFFNKLGRQWFSDSFGTIQGKEAVEQIQGAWIIEMGELAGLKMAEVNTIKHFISKQVDRFRVAYGHRTENFPRQCVFVASANDDAPFRDQTGNRRWWPVEIDPSKATKSVFNDSSDLNEYVVNQVWAEAMEMYRSGESLHLSKEVEAEAFEIQQQHTEVDPRQEMVGRYLDTLLPANWSQMSIYERRAFLSNNGEQDEDIQAKGTEVRQEVTVVEVWTEVFNGKQSDMNGYNTKPIHQMIRSLGWKKAKIGISKEFGRQIVYHRAQHV